MNISKLLGKIAEKGLRKKDAAAIAEVSYPTFQKYLTNPDCMPYRVIQKLANALCDTKEEAVEIFFAAELTRRVS